MFKVQTKIASNLNKDSVLHSELMKYYETPTLCINHQSQAEVCCLNFCVLKFKFPKHIPLVTYAAVEGHSNSFRFCAVYHFAGFVFFKCLFGSYLIVSRLWW